MGLVSTGVSRGVQPSKDGVEIRRLRLVGSSPAMARLREEIDCFAPFDLTVLILGSSGTGKELVAGEIHEKSPRHGMLLVPVNCAAIPETMFESELFGAVAGAATGVKARNGLIVEAEGGTLFLDEIGELGLTLQAKLLRFLNDKTFYPVGSDEPRKADVRIIAATNKDLPAEIKAGRFRLDLFHRLSEFIIETPALRDQPEVLRELCDAAIADYSARMHKDIKGITDEACAALERRPFEGNVRELRNVIGEAVAREKTDTIQVGSLRRGVREYRPPAPIDFPEGVHSPLDLAHRELAVKHLALCHGNISAAARQIGIDRKTLAKWREDFRLTPERETA